MYQNTVMERLVDQLMDVGGEISLSDSPHIVVTVVGNMVVMQIEKATMILSREQFRLFREQVCRTVIGPQCCPANVHPLRPKTVK